MQNPGSGGENHNQLTQNAAPGFFKFLYSFISVQLITVNIPSIFHWIPFLFLLFQSHLVAYWIPFQSNISSSLNLLWGIFFLDSHIDTISTEIFDYVILILNFLFVCSYAIGFIVFYKTHIIYYYYYLIMAIYADIIYPILMVPISVHAGHHINDSFQQYNSYDITVLIISLLLIILNFLIIFMYLNFVANSLYIKNSLFLCYNGNYHFLLHAIPCIFGFFQRFFLLFPNKFVLVIIILHLLANVAMLIWSFWLPQAQIWGGVLHASTFLSVIITDLVQIFLHISNSNAFFFFIPQYIICCLIIALIMKLRIKYIIKKRNSKNIVLRLQLCLITNNDFNDDLIDFSIRKARTNEQKLHIAKLCTLFPEYQPRAYELMTALRRVKNFSIFSNFLKQEILRIYTSKQAFSRISDIDYMNEQKSVIVYLQELIWKKIHYKSTFFADCENLYTKNLRAMGQWDILAQRYPNNILIALNYSQFLFNCMRDYEGAACWYNRSTQLEDGKIFQYDETIIHLLRSYPYYSNRVLGQSILSNMNELELSVKSQIIGKMTNEPELRIELQRAFSTARPKWISLMTVINIVKILSILAFWIHAIVSVSPKFEKIYSVYDLIKISSELSFCMEISSISYMANPMNIKYPNINAQNLSIINTSNPNQYRQYAILSIFYFEYLINWTSLHETNLEIDNILFHDSINAYNHSYINQYQIDYWRAFPFIANEIYYITNMVIFNSSFPDHIIFSGNFLADILNELITSFSNYGVKSAEREHEVNFLIFICCIITAIFIFLILNYAVLILFMKYISQIKHLMIEIPKEVIEQAFHDKIDPSYIENGEQTNRINFNQNYDVISTNSISHKSTALFLGIIDILFSIVLIGGIFFYYIKAESRININNSLMCQLYYVYQREILCFQLVNDACLALSYNETESTLLHMNMLIERLDEVNIKCKTGEIFSYEQYANVINQEQYKNQCHGNTNDTESPNCLSIDDAFILFIDNGKKFIRLNGSFDIFSQMFILFSSYFVHSLQNINSIVYDFSQQEKEIVFSEFFRAGIAFIFCAIFGFLFGLYFTHHLSSVFRSILILIQRLRPTDLVENLEILNFLFGNQHSKKTQSIASCIVMNSSIPLIYVNHHGIVEMINSSFSSDFEYDTVHIIGQNISRFICERSMANFESIQYRFVESLTTKGCYLIKGNGQFIKCNITMIPFYESKTRMKSCSIAFIEKQTFNSKKKQCEDLKTYCTMLENFLSTFKESKIELCSMVCIKLSNFEMKKLSSFQPIFQYIESLIEFFPDMKKILIGNGVIAALSFGEEASLKCAELSEKVVYYMGENEIHCGFSITIARGEFDRFQILSNVRELNVMKGPLIDDMRKLIELHKMGQIVISQKVYDDLISQSLVFHKEDGSFPCYTIETQNHSLFL